MKVKVQKIRLNAAQGRLSVALGARRGLPMEGVLMTLDRKIIEPDTRRDPTLVVWTLPAKTANYLYYGVITPLNKLRRAPRYERMFIQNGKPQGSKRPRVVKTRKVSNVEWAGAAEVVSVIAR